LEIILPLSAVVLLLARVRDLPSVVAAAVISSATVGLGRVLLPLFVPALHRRDPRAAPVHVPQQDQPGMVKR